MPRRRIALCSRQHIGFVFQLFHLFPFLNVLENVLVAAAQPGRAETAAYAQQLVKQFGLHPRRHHHPAVEHRGASACRDGPARRSIAPASFSADEPTGNLDPQNAAIVLDQIDQFHRDGGTVLLVTHEAPAASLCRDNDLA